MFKRQHYETIAAILHDLQSAAITSGDIYLLASIAVFRDRLIATFERDSSRFDRVRFLSACTCDRSTTADSSAGV